MPRLIKTDDPTDRAITRPRLLAGAAVLLCLVVVPITAAGIAGGSSGPKAKASGKLGKKFKKLNKKIKSLQAQLETVSKQVGPQGLPGAPGLQGPQGLQGQKGDQGDPGSLDAWGLAGNAGTDPANQFLGTTDNQPLNLRTNDARALRLEPASDGTNVSPNVIGGIADNAITAGVHSATIAGGGRSLPAAAATANRVTDNGGVIGGGANNQVGDGAGTLFDARYATLAGGDSNAALAIWATVGGGQLNGANAGGATVGGGRQNTASGSDATVGGGRGHTASGQDATVGGGAVNASPGQGSTVAGGGANVAGGLFATVGGGNNNFANGQSATVAGGSFSSAEGDFSLVAGRHAKNIDDSHDGVFLFADSTFADFNSAAADEFAARASGGFRFRTSSDLSTGCNLPAGSGTFACTSDRESKSGFAAVDPSEVLAQLDRLPIESWTYKADPARVRHIGPTAQLFKRAFGLGGDPRTISTVDADGVALAAIKGLNEEVEALSGGGGAPGGGSDLPLPLAALLALGGLGLLLAAGLGSAITLRMQGTVGRSAR